MKNLILILIIVGIVIIGGYFLLRGGYQAPAPTQEVTPPPSSRIVPVLPATQTVITVQDQETVEEQVIIQEVSFKDAGYVVIHLSQEGKPGPVVGNSVIYASGSYANVIVEVSDLQEGMNALFAMVHIDDGDGIFEFPGDDVPAKEDDNIVVKPLTVTKIAAPIVREITVSGTEFSFNPVSITVSAGEQLKITFRNDGNVIHNFEITELGVGTNTIGPGKTDSIEFITSTPGTYTFFCSVPGHQVKGMEGELQVQ